MSKHLKFSYEVFKKALVRGTKIYKLSSVTFLFIPEEVTQTNISKTLVLIIKRVNFTPTWGSVKLISAL